MASVTNHDVSFVAFTALRTMLKELVRQSSEEPNALRARLQVEVERSLAAFVDKERGGAPLSTDDAKYLVAGLFSDPAKDARN